MDVAKLERQEEKDAATAAGKAAENAKNDRGRAEAVSDAMREAAQREGEKVSVAERDVDLRL